MKPLDSADSAFGSIPLKALEGFYKSHRGQTLLRLLERAFCFCNRQERILSFGLPLLSGLEKPFQDILSVSPHDQLPSIKGQTKTVTLTAQDFLSEATPNTISTAFFFHSLEYAACAETLLQQTLHLLKPGGSVFILTLGSNKKHTPTTSFETTPATLAEKLGTLGFCDTKMHPMLALPGFVPQGWNALYYMADAVTAMLTPKTAGALLISAHKRRQTIPLPQPTSKPPLCLSGA